jgi:hypothetical protein
MSPITPSRGVLLADKFHVDHMPEMNDNHEEQRFYSTSFTSSDRVPLKSILRAPILPQIDCGFYSQNECEFRV